MTEDEHREPPPPLPQGTPKVSLGALWTSLLAPPFVTVASGVCIALFKAISHKPDNNSIEQMILMMPLVSGALILGCSFPFFDAVRKRYRGTSLVFLVCSYVLGQIILCTALWFGSCLVALAQS